MAELKSLSFETIAPMTNRASKSHCFFSCLIAYGGIACSANVDLGNNTYVPTGPVYAASTPPTADAGATQATETPFRIVDKEQVSIYQAQDLFTVDNGRLSWISLELAGNTYGYNLSSCDVDACASSVIHSKSKTFPDMYPLTAPGRMQADGDTVYWMTQDDPGTTSMTSRFASADIRVAKWPFGTTGDFEEDQGILYVSPYEGTVVRCETSDCANTTQRLEMNALPGAEPFLGGQTFGQDSDSLYLIGNSGNSSVSRILRVRKDNSAPFEEIWRIPALMQSVLALHGGNIYWVERLTLGRILTCPKSGCGDSPTTIGGGLNLNVASAPEIAVDDSSVYILEPPSSSMFYDNRTGLVVHIEEPGHIRKCPITGCDTPEVIYTSTSEVGMKNLIVDDRYVYFRGNDCTVTTADSSNTWFNDCGFIAVIPK